MSQKSITLFFIREISMTVRLVARFLARAIEAPVNAACTAIRGKSVAQMFPSPVKLYRQIIPR